MYMNAGYLHHSPEAFEDESRPLVVGSCGFYRLERPDRITTERPGGRVDWQLLYIAAGKAHFFLNGREEEIRAGQMVLYRPGEAQRYVYCGEDQTEAYWVHFTGKDAGQVIRETGMFEEGSAAFTGNSPEYHQLFLKMIGELQLARPAQEEYLSLLLRELLLLAGRQYRQAPGQPSWCQEEMEAAARYFNEHFSENISIEEYAASRHMSACWFIRSFRRYNKLTPMQYILWLRIMSARALLESTSYSISGIASIVGYDNALYFSRLFKKQTGMTPSEYRRGSRGRDEM